MHWSDLQTLGEHGAVCGLDAPGTPGKTKPHPFLSITGDNYMHKLKLDDLTVDSFVPDGRAAMRGTVAVHEDCGTEARCCGSGYDCSGYCTVPQYNYTCGKTCADCPQSTGCGTIPPYATCQATVCDHRCQATEFTFCNCPGAECLTGAHISCPIQQQ